MFTILARNWWMIALRGLVAVLLGLAALFLPGATHATLVFLFGAYVLLEGVLTIAEAMADDVGEHRWWMLLEGLTGGGVGVLVFILPNLGELVLLYLIAAWAVITGILEILAASELRQEIESEWLMALSGLASLLFGVAVTTQPETGALAITWMLGVYMIVFGVLFLLLAFRLWDLNKRMDSRMAGSF